LLFASVITSRSINSDDNIIWTWVFWFIPLSSFSVKSAVILFAATIAMTNHFCPFRIKWIDRIISESFQNQFTVSQGLGTGLGKKTSP